MLGYVCIHLSHRAAGSKTAGIRFSCSNSTTKQETNLGMAYNSVVIKPAWQSIRVTCEKSLSDLEHSPGWDLEHGIREAFDSRAQFTLGSNPNSAPYALHDSGQVIE